MPIKKSAAKALRQAKKREARNKRAKANISWLERQFLKAISASAKGGSTPGGKNKKEAGDLYLKLQKALDKAVQKGILKKNTASRKKSRLAKKLSQI